MQPVASSYFVILVEQTQGGTACMEKIVLGLWQLPHLRLCADQTRLLSSRAFSPTYIGLLSDHHPTQYILFLKRYIFDIRYSHLKVEEKTVPVD